MKFNLSKRALLIILICVIAFATFSFISYWLEPITVTVSSYHSEWPRTVRPEWPSRPQHTQQETYTRWEILIDKIIP